MRATLVFVAFVLFLDAMSFGLVLPVMPTLIQNLSGLSLGAAAAVSGFLLFTYALVQFLSAPVLGGLSDRYGRKPILLVSLVGFSFDYFIMALAPTLSLLFAARILSGVFGATHAAANAALADISEPSERARVFGMAGAAFGLGFIIGPAMGGVLGEWDYRAPFVAAGCISLATAAYGLLFFPETLARQSHRRFEWRRSNPIGALASISRRKSVMALLAGLFCIHLSQQSYASTWAFYTIEVAQWSPGQIGMSTAVYGIAVVIVQGVLAGPAIRRFGEARILHLAVLAGIIGYLMLAFAVAPIAIYLGMLIGALCHFAFPASQSLMTRATPDDGQGELQGAITSSYSLSCIVGPLVMAPLFASFVDAVGVYLPGAPFVVAALLLSAALIVFTRNRRQRADSPMRA